MTEELTITVVECENGDISVVPKRFLKRLKDPNFRWECGCGKGMSKKGLQIFVPKGSEIVKIENRLEDLSELEHNQWMQWSKFMYEKLDRFRQDCLNDDELTDFLIVLKAQWEESWKPYTELGEEQKEKDRLWARKVIEELKKLGDEK